MATFNSPLKINGVISTDKSVLQNLNDLCTAAGAFLTFDVSQGKWAVVINRTGSSVKSFDDSNIIGAINVSETGVNELYNSCRIEFPHKNLRDQTDFAEVTIASGDRYPNEIENTLQIQSSLINDPIQAQYLAGVELKQSRLNKVISFTTDYTSLGLKAGDLIDITSTMYGYSSKVFRVTKIEEIDEDIIGVNITALEYSADVYSTSGLVFVEKNKKTGILLKQQNAILKELDDADVAGSIGRLIAANVGLGIVNNLLNKLFGRTQIGTDANGDPIYSSQIKPADQAAEDMEKVLANAKRPALSTITAPAYVCEGQTITVTVGHSCGVCLFDIPDFDYDYEITGVLEEDVEVALTGTVTVSGGTGTLSIPTTATAGGASSQTLSITIGGLNDSVVIYDVSDKTYSTTASQASITEGGSVVFTVDTTNVADGTTIPYVISGSATGKVSSPALTGNITINSNTASITVVTTDDSAYTGTQSLTFTINPSSNPCSTGSLDFVATCSILDNETAPFTCQYVQVPLIWCPQYNGDDDQCQGMAVERFAYVPVALAGEATVALPTSVSVTKGNPSTVTVTNTVSAASSSSMGGVPLQIITSFNSVAPSGIVTGTTTTVYGYLA